MIINSKLSEGKRHTPVSQDSFVIVNMTDYENFKYKITYVEVSK